MRASTILQHRPPITAFVFTRLFASISLIARRENQYRLTNIQRYIKSHLFIKQKFRTDSTFRLRYFLNPIVERLSKMWKSLTIHTWKCMIYRCPRADVLHPPSWLFDVSSWLLRDSEYSLNTRGIHSNERLINATPTGARSKCFSNRRKVGSRRVKCKQRVHRSSARDVMTRSRKSVRDATVLKQSARRAKSVPTSPPRVAACYSEWRVYIRWPGNHDDNLSSQTRWSH